MDRLNRDARALNSGNIKNITGLATSEIPEINEARQNAMSAVDASTRNYYEDLIKNYYSIIDNLSSAASLKDASVYKFNEDNVMSSIKSDDKVLIANALNNPDNKKTYSTIYMPYEGKAYTQVVINFGGNKDNVNPIDGGKTPLIFTTSKLMNSEKLAKLNNSAEFRAGSQLYKNGVNNQNTTIGYYKIDDDYNNIYITPPYKDSNGETYREIRNGNDNLIDTVPEEVAIDLLMNFNAIKDLSNNPEVPTEYKKAAIVNFITNSAIQQIYGEDVLSSMIKLMFGYDLKRTE